MYPTKWTGLHFTNITNESYKKIPPFEGYRYRFIGFEELMDLLEQFNEYDKEYVSEKYCHPLLIYANTPSVLVLEKHIFEEKSATNFTGPRKAPVQSMIVHNDRNKIKEYFEKIRILNDARLF